MDERGTGWTLVRAPALDAWVGDSPVLTDDYAPVDQLLEPRPQAREPLRRRLDMEGIEPGVRADPHGLAVLETEGVGVRLGELHGDLLAGVGEDADADLEADAQDPADGALRGAGEHRRGGDVDVVRTDRPGR